MNLKEALAVTAILACGAVLNFGYPIVAGALSIPVGIEFVIVAYCLVVMTVSLPLAEVVGIGIISGVLNILSNPAHVATILSGQAATTAGILALSNLVSEPVGITVCFFAFAYLAGRIRMGAPLAVAFLATMASGLVYLVTVLLLTPGIIAVQPEYVETFLLRVVQAAVVNAVVILVIYTAISRHVKKILGGQAG